MPETLAEKRVLALDMSALVAGSKFRGEFEERMKKVMDEVSAAKDVVLFIDEVHTLVGAGAAEGSIDAANIMKPALSRGELQCIGATTLNEYRESIEKDSALERRFQPVMVGEPTEAEALAILKGLRDKYEAHHRVEISDAALEAAVKLSTRYLPDRFLPDKALDLIDEACSRVRLAAHTAPRDLKELELRIDALRKEKEAAVTMQDYEKAAQLRDEEARLSAEIAEGRRGWEKETAGTNLCIGTNDIAEVLSGWTNIPLTQLTEEESTRLLKLEETLHKRVIGQDEAVVSISRAVRRARAGLKSAERPIGSFIFLGPTGVGKTELAKALAEAMFGSQDNMVRIDMSEYMEKHAVSRLVGAPPGYIGYDEGGQLTEAVRRRPYSVVLLDEIEKAHPDVFNILLQVLDDGRLTDSNGRTVDFRNTIIIMTSNVGAKDLSRGRSMGFLSRDDEEAGYATMKEQVMAAMKECFRPEFINRLDDAIVFHQLTEAEIESICRLMVDDVSRRLAEKGMFISATAGVYRHLAKLGFDKEMGARPLRRTILRQIEDPLSEGILAGRFSAGDVIVARMKKGQIDLQKKSDAAVEDVAEDPAETAAETTAE